MRCEVHPAYAAVRGSRARYSARFEFPRQDRRNGIGVHKKAFHFRALPDYAADRDHQVGTMQLDPPPRHQLGRQRWSLKLARIAMGVANSHGPVPVVAWKITVQVSGPSRSFQARSSRRSMRRASSAPASSTPSVTSSSASTTVAVKAMGSKKPHTSQVHHHGDSASYSRSWRCWMRLPRCRCQLDASASCIPRSMGALISLCAMRKKPGLSSPRSIKSFPELLMIDWTTRCVEILVRDPGLPPIGTVGVTCADSLRARAALPPPTRDARRAAHASSSMQEPRQRPRKPQGGSGP